MSSPQVRLVPRMRVWFLLSPPLTMMMLMPKVTLRGSASSLWTMVLLLTLQMTMTMTMTTPTQARTLARLVLQLLPWPPGPPRQPTSC